MDILPIEVSWCWVEGYQEKKINRRVGQKKFDVDLAAKAYLPKWKKENHPLY